MRALKNLGWTLLGIAFFIGLVLLIAAFANGAVWLSTRVLPIIDTINAIALGLCLLTIPLIFFRAARGAAVLVYFIASYFFGLELWMYGLIATYTIWGMIAVIIGLFFVGIGIVPLGILAALTHGEWPLLVNFAIQIATTLGARFLAIYLATKVDDEARVRVA
jgi:hypothetical protein